MACIATALVIPANTVRAALLAVQEVGHLPENFLGHGGIGLASFSVILLPLWVAISSRARPAAPHQPVLPAGRTGYVLLPCAAVLAPVMAFATPQTPAPPELGEPPSLTSELDGSTWTDVSAWYWSALRHPLNGPRQPESVISL
jgi:hypothetical protein